MDGMNIGMMILIILIIAFIFYGIYQGWFKASPPPVTPVSGVVYEQPIIESPIVRPLFYPYSNRYPYGVSYRNRWWRR